MLKRATSGWWGLAAIAVAMVAFRIMIVWGVPFVASPEASHDDGLFLRLAGELRAGNWLGDYTVTTLIKGPGYPMFIALGQLARVPLPMAEQLLYAWACVLVVWALYPAVHTRWILHVAFVVMMLNPWSWGPLPCHFTRDTVSAHLALWFVAGAIGLVIRRKESSGVIVLWGVITGIGGAWAWLAREEGLWVVGPVGLLLGANALVLLWMRESGWKWRAAAMLVLPGIVGVLPVLGVCEMNRRHYGVFQVVELKCPEFEAAYGAMLRVGMGFHRQYVPLPRAGREALYPLSPAFKRMQPLLEGELGYNWSGHRPTDGPIDMQGGWFIWGFREAAQRVSGAQGKPALDYYRTLADEVNKACDAKLLLCGGRRSGMMTPLVLQDMGTVAKSMARFTGWWFWWPDPPDDSIMTAPDGPGAEMAIRMSGTQLCGPEYVFSVTGWAAADSRRTQIDAETEEGRRARVRVQWGPSPDVKEYLLSKNVNWPGSERCRFNALVSPDAQYLRLRVEKRPVLRAPLYGADLVAAEKGAMMRVESVVPPSKRAVPRWKHRLVHGCGLVVGCLAPVLTPIAFVWLIAAPFVRRLRHWRWIGIGAMLAGAIVIRTALLAYIDGTTYEIWGYRYFHPTFLVLVLFWCVASCAIAEAMMLARRGEMVREEAQ